MKLKSTLPVLLFFFLAYFSNAQNSKFDFSFSTGVGIPMGRMSTPGSEDKYVSSKYLDYFSLQVDESRTFSIPYGYASIGYNFDLRGTYRFHHIIGLTASLNGMFNAADESKFKAAVNVDRPNSSNDLKTFNSTNTQCYALMLGPNFTYKLNEKGSVDFYTMLGVANVTPGTIIVETNSTSETDQLVTNSFNTVALQIGGNINYNMTNRLYAKVGVSYFYASKDTETEMKIYNAPYILIYTEYPKYTQQFDVTLFCMNAGIGFKL